MPKIIIDLGVLRASSTKFINEPRTMWCWSRQSIKRGLITVKPSWRTTEALTETLFRLSPTGKSLDILECWLQQVHTTARTFRDPLLAVSIQGLASNLKTALSNHIRQFQKESTSSLREWFRNWSKMLRGKLIYTFLVLLHLRHKVFFLLHSKCNVPHP